MKKQLTVELLFNYNKIVEYVFNFKEFDMTKCKCSVCDCNVIHEEQVFKAKSEMLNDKVLNFISEFYKALSDCTRVKIINALDKQELCVCDICQLLNMTKSAVSHQLQKLKELNLIKSRRQGKQVFYALADEHVKQVFEISTNHVLEKLDEKEN